MQGLSVTDTVLREFAGLHHVLAEQAGVRVNLFQHAHGHGTPDAVFPNNWFSTHAAGEAGGNVTENTLVLYPMKTPNRCALQGLQSSQREKLCRKLQRELLLLPGGLHTP